MEFMKDLTQNKELLKIFPIFEKLL